MHKTLLITTSSFGKFDQSFLELLKKKFNKVILNPYGRKLSRLEVLELIKEYQPIAIIAGVEPLEKEVLIKAKNLKAISRAGVGLDNVDLQAARNLDISVDNTPDAPTIPVAELTVGMMLSLLRMIHRSDQGIRSRTWVRPMGVLLNGKTVGLVGCGRIGQQVASLLNTFGCKILGFDLIPCEHDHISVVEFEKLLRSSDLISLHLPYTSATHHLINTETITQMKDGVFLFNPSRGGLVNEKDLYAALKNKKIAGVALDSFEKEPYSGPLKEFDNVLLTAHIGSYAKEGRILMEKQSVNNLIKMLEQKGVL
jgi:D-3-phosphoglycerate dehydrogenase